MENPEEILHSLEEFSKMKPKDIPRELEDYLQFVAKTGDPVYQWSTVKSLFREKLINVITEFHESCRTVEIPPCPNVDVFNYDAMKNFILEKLDTFAAAPFTVQRICELLTAPRKEYNRIDKYMRALEKNILVVSTTEPGGRRAGAENGENIVNGIESDHLPEVGHINVEEMDDSPSWPRNMPNLYANEEAGVTTAPELKNGIEGEKSEEVVTLQTQSSVITTCSGTSEEAASTFAPDEAIPTVAETNDQQEEESKLEEWNAVSVTTADSDQIGATINALSTIAENSTLSTTEILPRIDAPTDQTEANVNPATEDILLSDSSSSTSGIENISPETSTSSPENLNISTSNVNVEKLKETEHEPEQAESNVTLTEEEEIDDTNKCSQSSDSEQFLTCDENVAESEEKLGGSEGEGDAEISSSSGGEEKEADTTEGVKTTNEIDGAREENSEALATLTPTEDKTPEDKSTTSMEVDAATREEKVEETEAECFPSTTEAS